MVIPVRIIFFYMELIPQKENYLKSIIIRILSEKNCSFSLPDCDNSVPDSRSSAARVILNKEFKIDLSFTCECSLFCSDKGINANYHLNRDSFKNFGESFCKALCDFHKIKSKESSSKKMRADGASLSSSSLNELIGSPGFF